MTVDESFGANVSVQLPGGSDGVVATGGTGGFPMDASSALCSSQQACQATAEFSPERSVPDPGKNQPNGFPNPSTEVNSCRKLPGSILLI